MFFEDELFAALTHGKFTDVAPLLVLWVLFSLIAAGGRAYGQYLIAFKRTNFFMFTEVVPSLVAIVVLWPALSLFGYYRVTITTLIVSLLT